MTTLRDPEEDPAAREPKAIPEEHWIDDEPAVAVALEHVSRHWAAEEENARRLGIRSSGILALLTTLLGLGLFRVGSLQRFEPDWAFVVVRAPVTGCLGCAITTLFFLLRPRRRGRASRRDPMASFYLNWPEAARLNPVGSALSVDDVREVAFLRTLQATKRLMRANIRKQLDLDRGQLLLGVAVLLAATALATYTWFGSTADATADPGATGVESRNDPK